MSNYPAGVTGREWQIAGPLEMEMTVECENEMTHNGQDGPCGWEGLVDATSIDEGLTWQWECERCLHEGETEVAW